MARLYDFTKGLIRENPILVIMLGLCPTLATSTTARDALGMGIAASFVMTCSNIVVSSLRRFVPAQIRIPSYIIVIATFVTIADYTMQALAPDLYRVLGVFVPLIVVNCVVFGRAEAFASKNTLGSSLLDGLGMSVGFTTVLTMLGIIRELLGNGTVFGVNITRAIFEPALIMILPPGAFFGIGLLMALKQKFIK